MAVRADLLVLYGDRGEEMAWRIMRDIGIIEELRGKGKGEELLIGIKPNLVVPQPAEWGATTSPELVRGIISFLKSAGFTNLVIMESSWVGDDTKEAFKVCGYEKIALDFGVPLVDLKDDQTERVFQEGLRFQICRQVLKADYLINVPVLKAHCQTMLSCALKNLKGCIPDQEKRRFHTLGLHHPIACLSKAIAPDLTIVDGIIGDLTYEGGGTPVPMHRVIGGRDPVLVDSYAAHLLGFKTEDIKYIKLAEKMGLGTTELKTANIVELNSIRETKACQELPASEGITYLSQWIVADSACSACYGGLFHALMRLQEKGDLNKISRQLHVGQGFKGKESSGIGIGACTRDFSAYVPGCPPEAGAILDFLESLIAKPNQF